MKSKLTYFLTSHLIQLNETDNNNNFFLLNFLDHVKNPAMQIFIRCLGCTVAFFLLGCILSLYMPGQVFEARAFPPPFPDNAEMVANLLKLDVPEEFREPYLYSYVAEILNGAGRGNLGVDAMRIFELRQHTCKRGFVEKTEPFFSHLRGLVVEREMRGLWDQANDPASRPDSERYIFRAPGRLIPRDKLSPEEAVRLHRELGGYLRKYISLFDQKVKIEETQRQMELDTEAFRRSLEEVAVRGGECVSF